MAEPQEENSDALRAGYGSLGTLDANGISNDDVNIGTEGNKPKEFIEGPERDALWLSSIVNEALMDKAPELFEEGKPVDKAEVARFLSEELKKLTPIELENMLNQVEQSSK